MKVLQYCTKINGVCSTVMLPSSPQLYVSTGMFEKTWMLKLLGVFESLRGEETKKLGNNVKGIKERSTQNNLWYGEGKIFSFTPSYNRKIALFPCMKAIQKGYVHKMILRKKSLFLLEHLIRTPCHGIPLMPAACWTWNKYRPSHG